MTRSPRYAVHPGIAHMGGGAKEILQYLKMAPACVGAMYAGPRAALRPMHDPLEEVALALGGLKGQGVLIATGGFQKKDRITHKIGISRLADIDDRLKAWLLKAYRLDG